jgi:hypothetical protein
MGVSRGIGTLRCKRLISFGNLQLVTTVRLPNIASVLSSRQLLKRTTSVLGPRLSNGRRTATIRSRSGTWQARVTRIGFPEESKSFTTKADAQVWVRSIEAAMDKGTHQANYAARDLLLKEVLGRYKKEVTPTNRRAKREAEGIEFMSRQKIADYSMATLTPAIVAAYRDERLKSVGAGTIIGDSASCWESFPMRVGNLGPKNVWRSSRCCFPPYPSAWCWGYRKSTNNFRKRT